MTRIGLSRMGSNPLLMFILVVAIYVVLSIVLGFLRFVVLAAVVDPPGAWLLELTGHLLNLVAVIVVASTIARQRLSMRVFCGPQMNASLLFIVLGGVLLGAFSHWISSFISSYSVRILPGLSSVNNAQSGIIGMTKTPAGFVAMFLSVCALAPLSEEILLRGFGFRTLRTRYGIFGSTGIIGLVASAMHIYPVLMPDVFVFNVLACICFELSGDIWLSFTVHATTNCISLLRLIYG